MDKPVADIDEAAPEVPSTVTPAALTANRVSWFSRRCEASSRGAIPFHLLSYFVVIYSKTKAKSPK